MTIPGLVLTNQEKPPIQVMLDTLALALEEIGEGEMLYVPNKVPARNVTVKKVRGGHTVWLEPSDEG